MNYHPAVRNEPASLTQERTQCEKATTNKRTTADYKGPGFLWPDQKTVLIVMAFLKPSVN